MDALPVAAVPDLPAILAADAQARATAAALLVRWQQ